MSSIRSVEACSAPSVNALTLTAIASCFSSTPAVSASMSFLNWSDTAKAFGGVLGDLADIRKVLLHVVLQRLDVVANGLDLALGIFQHVFDIGHMSPFQDFEGCVRPGAERYRPFMRRVILIPRL